MTKRHAWMGALVLFGMTLSGCTSLSKRYPVDYPTAQILPLHRNEYKILGDTEGQACKNYLFWAALPWFSGEPTKTVVASGASSSFLCSVPIIGMFCGSASVEDEALYNAVDKIPGTDSVMSMRVSTHRTFSVLGIYKEECATVRGKAFEIKTDQ